MFCLVDCYVIGVTGEFSAGELLCHHTSLMFRGVVTSLVCLKCFSMGELLCHESCRTSLVFDCLALVNCGIVVLLGRVSSQLCYII